MISKDDKGMYSIRYNDLVAPMVKAIQEQQAIITSLEDKLLLLEKRLEMLEKNNTN
jgi:trimeric autotransporter adhesin